MRSAAAPLTQWAGAPRISAEPGPWAQTEEVDLLKRWIVILVVASTALFAGTSSVAAWPEALPPAGDPPDPYPDHPSTVARTIDVSDDGRYIIWTAVSTLTLSRDFWSDTVTGQSIQLGDAFNDNAMDISSDGQRVLMRNVEPGVLGSKLEIVEPHSGAVTTLADSHEFGNSVGFNAAKFTDNDRYATFVTYQAGVRTPYRQQISSGTRTKMPVLPELNIEDEYVLSGDGRYLVYERQSALYRRTLATGESTNLGMAPATGFVVSPDGRYVVSGPWFGDLTTGERVQFVRSIDPHVPLSVPNQPVQVSTDGSVVVFATADALSPTDTNGTADIYLWDRNPGTYRRVSLSDLGTEVAGPSASVVMTPDAEVALVDTYSGDASRSWSPYWEMGGGLTLKVDLTEPHTGIGIVDATLKPHGGWLHLERDGTVRGYSSALAHADCEAQLPFGSADGRPALHQDEVATSISPTPSGAGYWVFTSLGRAITCGDAGFFGDLSDLALDGEIIDSASTPTGMGYYMVGADGGLFAFGDAGFRGSVPQVLPGVSLDAPIVAVAVTGTNRGYRMVAADGGMFNFGDAQFFGSIPQVLPGVSLAAPAIDMVASDTGYLIVASDGGLFNFGESPFHGSLGGSPPELPVTAVLVVPNLSGYVMLDADGSTYPFGSGDDLLD